ncbi:YitT family protein [Treponema sp. TIM-1]|uniref:YitT family protein n=1 Tax=Treponema sp. TIM-1 TaxID=2898417 RepID=UPI0039801602
MDDKNSTWYTVKRFLLIIAGALLMAFDLNTFVHAGGLVPGGFTGLTLLIKECALRFGGVSVPFSIILFVLNAIPAAISFKYIGKWFTIYSGLMVILTGLFTDWMPAMFIQVIQLHDELLSAVFGGILNGAAICLCLYAEATSGGTDFIAIFISEKYRKDAWNYIFAGNCVILLLAAFLFELNRVLYSIIFQFTTTMTLSGMYRGYQQRTLLIITGKSREVYELIREMTNHAATSFSGIGRYEMAEREMLYSVVSAGEVNALVAAIKRLDPDAFINVLKTEQLNGRFYQHPKD